MGSKGAVSIIFRGKGSEQQEMEYVDKVSNAFLIVNAIVSFSLQYRFKIDCIYIAILSLATHFLLLFVVMWMILSNPRQPEKGYARYVDQYYKNYLSST